MGALLEKQEQAAAKSKKRVTYVGGCSPAVIKKFAQYEFGENSVIRIMHENGGLEVILNRQPELWQIQKYEKFLNVKVRVTV